jgi:TolA-binding protein
MIIPLLGEGCGRKSALEEALKEYEAGHYREAVFVIRHHFRKGGDRTPDLLFLQGKALLRLGIEAEAGDVFAEAYSTDSTWAAPIAAELRREALGSLEAGLDTKGNRFLLQSIGYEKRQNFGRFNRNAGNLLLDRKDYEGAAYYLSFYLSQRPDTTGAAEVMMNLGAAFEGMRKYEEATDIYHRFQELYPKSRLRTTVQWKLENLLLERAVELQNEGEEEEAESILTELSISSTNPLVRERAAFLLGEIAEGRGDLEAAVRYYHEVINLNLGSSGRLVEKAKERIEKLERARTR